MTGNTNPREKVRAVFLAALMVLSVFAMTMAFAGSAAALASSAEITGNDPVQPDSTTTVTFDTDDNATYQVGIDADMNGSIESEEVVGNITADNGTESVDFVPSDAAELGPNDNGDYDVAVIQAADASSVDLGSAATDLSNADTSTTLGVDSAAPSIDNVALGEDSGNLTLSFDSNETLGTISVDVEGPTSGAGVYTFDETDFTEDAGTYTLDTAQEYDDGEGTYTATVDTAEDEAGNDGATGESDSYTYSSLDTVLIDGEVSDKQLRPIENDQDVSVQIDANGTNTASAVQIVNVSNISTFNDQAWIDGNDYVDDAGFYDNGDDVGTYYIELANFGDTTEYDFTADLANFDAFDGSVDLGPGDTTTQNLRLTRQEDADTLEVTAPAEGSTYDLEGDFDATVFVQTEDTQDNGGIGNLAPRDGETVTTTVVSVDDPNNILGTGDVTIPGQNTTDLNGEAMFNVALDLGANTADDFDEDVEVELRFEATSSSESDTLNVTFEAEPPSGQGTISGTVNEFDASEQLGAASNSEVAEGITVHAVQVDRVNANTETVTTSQNTVYRVFNDTSGEALDVRSDYLFRTNDATVFQNESAYGDTGFEVGDEAGVVNVTVLEEGDYTVQEYNAGSWNNVTSISASNDLTYDATEERYDGTPAIATDETNANGGFELANLYTNGSTGLDYVVIAGEGNGAVDQDTYVGFANARAYDTVTVHQNAQDDAEQNSIDLTVQDYEIDVFYDYGLDVTLVNEDGDLVKESEIQNNDNIEVRVNVTATSQEDGEIVPGAAEGQELDLSLTDAAVGTLTDETPTVDQTDSDGTPYATTTFESGDLSSGSTNITAATTNDLDEMFETDDAGEATVSVYKPIEITGDVVNENDENIWGANVTLYTVDSSDNLDTAIDSTRSGQGGSYVFSDVQSNQRLAIEAVAEDADGNEVNNTRLLNNGNSIDTSLGGEDIVVIGADSGVFDRATFQVSNVNPADATISPGDSLTVTADVTNSGDVEGTQTVALVVFDENDNDVLVLTQELTLGPDATQTVEFTADSVDVAAGDYTHVVMSDDTSAEGTLTVEQPDPVYEITSLDAPETVTAGDSMTVTATIENTGGDGDQAVMYMLGNQQISIEENVAIDAGQTGTVEFTVDTSNIDAGDYTHGVYVSGAGDDQMEDSITVESSGDTDFQDVLDLIEAYNDGDADFQDVLDAIEAYNENNA